MTDSPGWTSPGGVPPGYGPPPGQQRPGSGAPPGYPPPSGGWGWDAPRPPDVKPGVVPLRPLGLGEILDGAISIVRAYPRVTLGLSAIVATVSQIAQTALLLSVFSNVQTLEQDVAVTPDELVTFFGQVLGALLVTLVVTTVAQLVLTGMLTSVVGKAVLGQPVSVGDTWVAIRPLLLRLLGVSLLTGLLVFLGLFALLVGAVFVYVVLSLATPALVLERSSVLGALRRSRILVKGSFWRVLGILLLTWLIAFIVTQILTLPFSLLGGGTSAFSTDANLGELSTLGLLVTTFGAILGQTLVAPFDAGVRSLLYIDRRMRVEGLDVTLMQAAGVAPPAPPSAPSAPTAPTAY